MNANRVTLRLYERNGYERVVIGTPVRSGLGVATSPS